MALGSLRGSLGELLGAPLVRMFRFQGRLLASFDKLLFRKIFEDCFSLSFCPGGERERARVACCP